MDFLKKAYKHNFEGAADGIYQFRFISMGETEITKVVSFALIKHKENWYNLGFGNLEQRGDTGFTVNEVASNNNSDFERVLATVFNCILHFLEMNEGSVVVFFGNTIHKNMLYKRKIGANLKTLERFLIIMGGRITNQIPINERIVEIKKKNRTVIRTIQEKDIGPITDDIEIEYIEKFDSSKSEAYQFTTIQVK